ncbi:MAG: lycopene cyclase family protein, partial [Candidatus Cyclobacteriaceae bacterium M2_1C_046]
MNTKSNYDYIIAGAGASGLSLAWHMINSPLKEKKILVVDADLTTNDDKTWCFWHNGIPPFQHLIHKSYSQAKVIIRGEKVTEKLKNYPYYCIKSKNYKSHLLNELQSHSSIDLLEAPVEQIIGSEKKPVLKTPSNSYSAEYIFQSCFIPPQLNSSKIQYPLVQSFLGYDIETQQKLFEPDTFLMMDFDESYEGGLAFMYVLPWSQNNALLEYTIFDEQVKPDEFYRKKIELYLSNKYNLKRIDYKISRMEYGEIPMQDLPYVPWYQPRVMNLGR